MAPPKVGERIKELRERLRPHVSQEDLADKIGVRSETISRWERGASAGYYDEEVLDRLATALEVTPEDIVGPPAVASPGQIDRIEARLDEVQERINELRDMFKQASGEEKAEGDGFPSLPTEQRPSESRPANAPTARASRRRRANTSQRRAS